MGAFADWLIPATATTGLGLGILALSQPPHWFRVNKGATARAHLRPVGLGLLVAGFVACVLRDGAGLAALIWPMLVASLSVLLAFVLAFAPGALRPLAKLLETPDG